jgi:hypothetical protein
MAGEDPKEEQRLRVAATAANGAEAELILQRLAQAGIVATSQRTIGGPEWGESGSQYVYVEAADLGRARELLNTGEGLSEDELAKLSEQGEEEAAESPRRRPPNGEDA